MPANWNDPLKVTINLMENHISSAGRFPFKLAKIIAVVYLLLVYPLAMIIPYEVAWENGPIENLQVVILLTACFVNFRLYRKSDSTEKMYLWQAVFLALLVGRELSWGRVFFQVGINEYGPSFIKLPPDQKMILNVVLGLIMVWLVVNMVRWVPWKKLAQSIHRLPWCFIGLMFACVAFMNIGEKGLFGIDLHVGGNIEELAELDLYFCLCCLSAWYSENFCKQ